MTALGGGLKRKGREGGTECRAAQPHPSAAASGTGASLLTPGCPRPLLSRSGALALAAVGCHAPSQQAGVTHQPGPTSPHFPRLGVSALLLFGQTSQNNLSQLCWPASLHSLLNPHPSLIFRVDTPISQLIAPPWAFNTPHPTSKSFLPVATPPQAGPPSHPSPGRASCRQAHTLHPPAGGILGARSTPRFWGHVGLFSFTAWFWAFFFFFCERGSPLVVEVMRPQISAFHSPISVQWK